MISAFDAGRDALRWVTDGAVAADGGSTWPRTKAPGAPLSDDIYYGTAGVLVALAEARLSGIADFDQHARAAVSRLRSLASADAWAGANVVPEDPAAKPDQLSQPDFGLYTGLSGCAAALHIWAQASDDSDAEAAAQAAVDSIAQIAVAGPPVSADRDLLAGEAGILLTLIEIGGASVRPAASVIADRLVGQASWFDGHPDWYLRADARVLLPNFSHGAAGIGYALAVAGAALDRHDLLDIAGLAGQRLVRLGGRADGTLAVPNSIPLVDPSTPVNYGWCHGPTGTLRLFQLLDGLRPGQGWADHAEAGRRAIRGSGLPTRRYPGFWDNLGQCCGTAGVGELALDRYQQTGHPEWLAWALTLAEDVLDRRIDDTAGIRWSHTEHRLNPSDLEPELGWMQGAAGIASWLLRLARIERDGAPARRIRWPDQCPFG